MKMKKLTAVFAAAALTMWSLVMHITSPEEERALRVHAASADDLTFQIVTVESGIEPDFAFIPVWNSEGGTNNNYNYYTTTARLAHQAPNETVTPAPESVTPAPEPYRYAILKKCDAYAAGTLEIPSEYEGVPVKVIGEGAFQNCYDLKKVIVPDSIVSVRDGNSNWNRRNGAFYGCEGLTEIVLPAHLNGISCNMFAGCSSLKQIVIPDGVTGIDEGAFRGCSSLVSVTIPDSVTLIGSEAFQNCKALSALDIPDGVAGISPDIISGTAITSIKLPESVKYLNRNAFERTKLEQIILPEGLLRIDESAFAYCTELKTLTIPQSVTNIRKNAFSGCTSLESITILNPECALNDFGCKPQTIYGAWGSTAETFAAENGIAFRPLDDAPQPEVPETPALPEAPAGSVFGDVSGDRDITAADAQYVLLFYTEKITGKQPTWFQITGNPDSPV